MTTREVQVRTLRSVVDEFKIPEPDLLTIDVEGHELQVLSGCPFDVWKPTVILIESCKPCTPTPSYGVWEYILLDNGYVYYKTCGINRFYVRDDEE